MELLKEVLQLKDLLKKDEIIKQVHIKEELMLNDEPTQGLIFRYQQAMSLYNDAIRYHLELDKYQKDLSKAKEELYSSKFVKEYLEKIKEDLFQDIIDLKIKGKSCNI